MGGMIGMSATTGRQLGGIDHLQQSIRDILTTPVGSRVMRRDYGSNLSKLVDAPMHRGTIMGIYAAAADAIGRWEPRFRLQKIQAIEAEPGKITLELSGEYLPDGRSVTLYGITVR